MPLSEYKENLKQLVQHPAVREHGARIVLITPPPVNEYQLVQPGDRMAGNTKLYAEGTRESAALLGVPVADIWTRFMQLAGWSEGQPLLGSRDVPNSVKLQSFFTDGSSIPSWFLTVGF